MFADIRAYVKYLFRSDKKQAREIKRICGFYPDKLYLYKTALIHRSASQKTKEGTLINNERLEFLGDSVLDLIIGEYLYKKYPGENEGFLTQFRSRIVNGENLSEITKHTGLAQLVITNVKPNSNGIHLYEDAFEAILGAIFLDRGIERAKEFIIKHILTDYLNMFELEHNNSNYKSRLIEWGQKNKKNVIFHTDLETPGSKYFVSFIRVEGQTLGSGIGISKKEAEQKAAKVGLAQIEEEEEKENEDQQA